MRLAFLIFVLLASSAFPQSDAEQIESQLSLFTAAVKEKRPVGSFFTPNRQQEWRNHFEELRFKNPTEFELKMDGAPRIDGDEAKVPVSLVMKAPNEQTTMNFRLNMRRVAGQWYIDEPDFWKFPWLLVVVLLTPVMLYTIGIGVQAVHAKFTDWQRPSERTKWIVLAFVPFTLPLYFAKAPWRRP